MKILVAAASKHGATEGIAREIGDTLSAKGLDVTFAALEDIGSIDGYGAAVIGSAVYMGRWLKAARDFVEANSESLRAIPVWLFASGPVGAPPKPEEDPADAPAMVAASGAREHRVFAGELDKKRLGFGEKLVAAAVRAPEGDFRDWEAVRAWAEGIAGELQAGG